MATLLKLRWMVLAVPIVLSACGVGGGANTPSVRNAILAAEERGDLPKLNQDDTLTGVDADGNGVRDDVDDYIDKLPDTPAQKAALRQASRAFTNMITADVSDKLTVQAALDKLARASNCKGDQYQTRELRIGRGEEMRKININTRIRLKAYAKFSTAASGKNITLPHGSSCDE